MAAKAGRRKTTRKSTSATRCQSLYRFIRLRLGEAVSDREIARRWRMEWRSFAALKQGTRQVPRIDELERLASVLGCDPAFVFQVARGVGAEEVAGLLLRESRLRAIIDRFHDGVFTIDPQGRLQDANPGLAELVGVEQPELLTRSLHDLVAPESTGTVLGALAAIARDGRARDLDLVLRRPDGQTRVVTLDATRVAAPDGTLLGAQAVVRDVTVERQLAGELEQQRRTLHVIFDSIPAACILFEADSTIAAANPPVEHVCSATAAEMVGRSASEVFGTPGPEGCPVTRAFQSGRIEQQVSWVENRKGERRYVHRTAGPVMSRGKVERVVEILVDVSEQIHRGDLRVLQFWRGQAPGSVGQVGHERRATPRAQVSFPAHLRWQERESAATVESLGAEGLFVTTTDDPPPVGAEVEIEWELPSDRAVVSARALVVWRRKAAARGQPAGFGVRFQHIAPVRLDAAVLERSGVPRA